MPPELTLTLTLIGGLGVYASRTNPNPNHNRRPWCLCLPNWVHKKDWYQKLIRDKGDGGLGAEPPFYMAPIQRYDYWMPSFVQGDDRCGKPTPDPCR